MSEALVDVNDTMYLYLSLYDAKREIVRRWADRALREKVQEYWGSDFEVLSKNGPSCFLGRNVISPNYELRYFLGLCEEIDSNALFIEHRTDKFVASNPDKYHLARMYFYGGRGKNNGEKFTAQNVIDIGSCEGREIGRIQTLWDENFVDFHHRILSSFVPGVQRNIIDVAAISKLKNKKLSQNYDIYLSIFAYFGILFENYLPHKSESGFLDVVHKAFDRVQQTFGVKPMVVPLSPMADQDDLYWWSYPESLKGMIVNKK